MSRKKNKRPISQSDRIDRQYIFHMSCLLAPFPLILPFGAIESMPVRAAGLGAIFIFVLIPAFIFGLHWAYGDDKE